MNGPLFMHNLLADSRPAIYSFPLILVYTVVTVLLGESAVFYLNNNNSLFIINSINISKYTSSHFLAHYRFVLQDASRISWKYETLMLFYIQTVRQQY